MPLVSEKNQVLTYELIRELNNVGGGIIKNTTNYKNNIVTSLKTKVNTLTSAVETNISIKPQTGFYKKSQYKHMRKSMANMIRIQNDKAVALPVDTRIQLLTVSKDIIHS
jgi:heme/copper-type cytochrome/quinol oxidase subunit 2